LTLTAYTFLLSMFGVLVAHLAAKAMFGVRAGLVAACLAALLPIDVLFATVLLPDMPAAFWMNAGVLLVYAGSRRSTVKGKAALGALAGLALFASWLCKETVLYLLPFLAFYLVWLVARDRRDLPLLLAGSVVVVLLVGLEGWIYHRHVGDCLHRYHVAVGGADRTLPVWTLAGVARYFAYRASEVLRHSLLNAYFAFTLAAALVACACAVLRRSRSFLFPGLWFCWLLLVFGFGSQSFSTYRPLSLFMIRYQYPMLLPAILLVSGLVGSLLSPLEPDEARNRHRRRLLYGLLISVYLAGVSLVMVVYGIRSRWGPPSMGLTCWGVREMSRILKPTDPLYTDPHTALALEFFWKFSPADSARDIEGIAPSQLPSGVHVLLNRDEVDALRYNTGYEPPEFLDSVPRTWQRLRQRDNATLYWVPPPRLADSAREH
jgi:4-amino-4-deoxy-L-arabinose transferase-like glycosyltransferase